MKRNFRWMLTISGVGGLLLVGLVPAQGEAISEAEAAVAIVHQVHESPSVVRSHWTADRMQSAEPIPLPEPADIQVAADSLSPQGPPGGVEAAPPTVGVDERALVKEGSSLMGGPLPYTRVEVDPVPFPYRTNGKLFMETADGPAECSATAVSSPNRSLLMTAGHCLVDETGGSSMLMFVPGYRYGSVPFGKWPVINYVTTVGWEEYGSFSYDLAAMVVATAPDGARLQDVIGGRGMSWNLPYTQTFDSFGYPADLPFDGESLWMCRSAYGGYDPTEIEPVPLAIGCDMTSGSSGGGWIINGTTLNSVNSYGTDQYGPEVMFGPYFGQGAANLFAAASNIPSSATFHPVGLSLRFKRLRLGKWGAAIGTMRVSDGYSPCVRNSVVVIYRETEDALIAVSKRVKTDSRGRYVALMKLRAGEYFAWSPEAWIDDFNVCPVVESNRVVR